jgi:hypothetical protein
MIWPRRPEYRHIARVGAHLLAVVAVLFAVCGPALAQSPDPAPPAPGPAPDPAPQAAPAPARAPAEPPPAQEQPQAPAQEQPQAPAEEQPLAPAPTTEPATQPARAPAATRAAQPPRESVARRQNAKRRRPVARQKPPRPRPRPRIFAPAAIPGTVPAPSLVIERGGPLATTEARLAALALLVAAAGSLGLIGHLRRETMG